ncbi:MAG: hypothetical protein K2Q26_09185 [Bdellovibrionales bacterium]|nr:hypothetical protein [Bdellovibrionales bacterium]
MSSQLAIALKLGVEFLGSMIGGLVLGYIAQTYFGTSPTWSMGVGAFVGLFLWVYRAILLQKKISENR